MLAVVAAFAAAAFGGARLAGGNAAKTDRTAAADHEEGNLADWYAPATVESTAVDHGGGEFDSGDADSYASREQAHGGAWSAEQIVDTSAGPSGTRLFRWRELQQLQVGEGLEVSAWIYIPLRVTVRGSFNLVQFKSKSEGETRIDPFWQLNIFNRPDGSMYLVPGWGFGGTDVPGPGPRDRVGPKWLRPVSSVNVPVRRWFRLDAFIRPSAAFEGEVAFWQDGILIAEFTGVRTGYARSDRPNGTDDQWSINAYAAGLEPSRYRQFVDDVVLSPMSERPRFGGSPLPSRPGPVSQPRNLEETQAFGYHRSKLRQ